MTSKEALENFILTKHCMNCKFYEDCDDYLEKPCDKWRRIIKQDLDKLEKFAHENASLHTEIASLHTKIESLQSKNSKLKQVIEILKSKIEFEDLGEMQSGNMYRGYFNDCLDEEEVKSVKEVFENVKD